MCSKDIQEVSKYNHNKLRSENILGRTFSRQRINEVWTSDITYIRTEEGWLYLAAVIDTYSRKVIGWQLERNLTSELVEGALKNALIDRKIDKGIIFHSGQGIQYATRRVLEKYLLITDLSKA